MRDFTQVKLFLYSRFKDFIGDREAATETTLYKRWTSGFIASNCVATLALCFSKVGPSHEPGMRAPHLSATLNAKHAADTGREVFPLCFLLFPHHYILTLTSGCDKSEAWNLATYPQSIPSAPQHRGLFRHSHTFFPRPPVQYERRRPRGTMLGFKAAAAAAAVDA